MKSLNSHFREKCKKTQKNTCIAPNYLKILINEVKKYIRQSNKDELTWKILLDKKGCKLVSKEFFFKSHLYKWPRDEHKRKGHFRKDNGLFEQRK